jgi:hypothetical protein
MLKHRALVRGHSDPSLYYLWSVCSSEGWQCGRTEQLALRRIRETWVQMSFRKPTISLIRGFRFPWGYYEDDSLPGNGYSLSRIQSPMSQKTVIFFFSSLKSFLDFTSPSKLISTQYLKLGHQPPAFQIISNFLFSLLQFITKSTGFYNLRNR